MRRSALIAMRSRSIGSAIAAALTAVVVGVSAPSGFPAPTLANACALFTSADAKAALGAAVSPGVFVPLGRDQDCRYSTPTMSKTLSVAFHPLVKSDFAKLVQANDLKPIPKTSGPTYSAPGGLTAWRNGTQVSVVVRPPGAVSAHAAEQLISHVLARL
jgi:hypothetical protein